MKKLITLILLAFALPAMADTTMSRDAEGAKIQGASYTTIRTASIGTKGFKCFSTATKLAWEVKAVATATTDGAGVGFKLFYNGSESIAYPVSAAFMQWNNSPVAQTRTITSVCLRGYSTATAKTAFGVFQ